MSAQLSANDVTKPSGRAANLVGVRRTGRGRNVLPQALDVPSVAGSVYAPSGSPIRTSARLKKSSKIVPNDPTPTHILGQPDDNALLLDKIAALEKDKKDLQLTVECLQAKLDKIERLERQQSLRSSGPVKSPIVPIGIKNPNKQEVTRIRPLGVSKLGPGLLSSTLAQTAAIYASGLQYEKYREVNLLLDRPTISHETFYQQTKIIQQHAQDMCNESFDSLAEKMLALGVDLGEIALEVDGAWNKRYGHSSKLGNFGVMMHSKHEELNRKLLWACSKNIGHTRTSKDGKVKTIVEGNHNESSHAMEGNSFKEFLDWAEKKNIKNLITYFIADKDSTLREIGRDNGFGDDKFLGDPGHWKARIYRTLEKTAYFGTRKPHQGLAARISTWVLRCIMESRAKYPNGTKEEMYEEFKRRFAYTEQHFTGTCDKKSCPCQDWDTELTADIESVPGLPNLAPELAMNLKGHLDGESFAALSLVNRPLNQLTNKKEVRIAESSSEGNQPKGTIKKYLDPERDANLLDNLRQLFVKIEAEASQYCHHYHTCWIESLWALRTSYGEKRIHYYGTWQLRSECTFLHKNYGHEWKLMLLKRLGLPIPLKAQQFFKTEDKNITKTRKIKATRQFKMKKAQRKKDNKHEQFKRTKKGQHNKFTMLSEKVLESPKKKKRVSKSKSTSPTSISTTTDPTITYTIPISTTTDPAITYTIPISTTDPAITKNIPISTTAPVITKNIPISKPLQTSTRTPRTKATSKPESQRPLPRESQQLNSQTPTTLNLDKCIPTTPYLQYYSPTFYPHALFSTTRMLLGFDD